GARGLHMWPAPPKPCSKSTAGPRPPTRTYCVPPLTAICWLLKVEGHALMATMLHLRLSFGATIAPSPHVAIRDGDGDISHVIAGLRDRPMSKKSHPTATLRDDFPARKTRTARDCPRPRR